MPSMGIQNFDRWTNRVRGLQKSCQEDTQAKALEAAGDVLKRVLEAATPISQSPRDKHRGLAQQSVINVPARQKQYGTTRRLIGYSKKAFYMLFVVKGHRIVTGGRRARKGGKGEFFGEMHGQAGKGRVVGAVGGRDFVSGVWSANIERAKQAYREVIKRAVQQ
jgi:hypothetical protein